MSSLTLSFDIVGDNHLESIFNNLERIPDDFRPVFEKMAEDFWEHERQVFDEEGPGWRPLSPKYSTWKARHFPGKRILERTGALKASLTGPDGADSIFEVYPHEMRLGTANPYAIYHQTGSIKVVDHPPQRKEMTLPAGLQRKWNSRMARWLQDEVDLRSV